MVCWNPQRKIDCSHESRGYSADHKFREVSFVKHQLNLCCLCGELWASELLHASVFEADINKIALVKPFLSYAELALVPDYKPSFITSVVAGAIKSYDLPDVMAAVNPRSLLVVNPVDPLGKEYINGESAALLKFPSEYHEDFTVVRGLSQNQLPAQILSWLSN